MTDRTYVPPQSSEEVIRRYARGERRFTDMDLSGSLEMSNFKGAMLAGAVFDGSELLDANFTGADLRNTSFRLCGVKLSNFQNADLRGACFEEASVEAANFEGAKYQGDEFVGAYCYSNTIKLGDGFPDYADRDSVE